MLFPRTKLVDTFINQLENNNPEFIVLYGGKGSGKTSFLKLLENGGVLNPEKTEYITTDIENHVTQIDTPEYIVIDAEISQDISEIRAFIKSKLPDSKVLFLTEAYTDTTDNEMIYEIPYISFREFAEGHHHSINIGEILEGRANIEKYSELKELYIHLGQYGKNLILGRNSDELFEKKLEEMKESLFTKEYDEFLEFIRTLAMSVGELFKEEKLAKLIGISRRKVRKYTEILAKHHVVLPIGGYYTNTSVELSRHVKLYFTDLSYMDSALGVGYYHGSTKQGVIENFILLELQRKLKQTHTIYFYRKKSGAEIQFVLEEIGSEKLTPIEITLRGTGSISQALKTFDETYNEKVDHYMIFNESIAEQKELSGKSVIVLPHFAA
ncbi:ATP-binding protein [Candidatus Gracilibacteria bacterium]|nr:ATP-binding protein [Candidatus Gracilibacteria bacterium]